MDEQKGVIVRRKRLLRSWMNITQEESSPWTDIYQAGSDYVVEIRYFAEAILR